MKKVERKTEERLEEAKEIIDSQRILDMNFHGGELCFYIFDYPAKDEMLVREFVRDIMDKFSGHSLGLNILELDLYTLMMEILENEKAGSRSILDMIPELERDKGSKTMEKALKSIMNPEKFVGIIEKKLQLHIHPPNLIFITGVGKVFPFVRSHNILNNLHSLLDKIPVIMFYPGKYDQKELSLFEEIKDDNYYRAFRLVED